MRHTTKHQSASVAWESDVAPTAVCSSSSMCWAPQGGPGGWSPPPRTDGRSRDGGASTWRRHPHKSDAAPAPLSLDDLSPHLVRSRSPPPRSAPTSTGIAGERAPLTSHRRPLPSRDAAARPAGAGAPSDTAAVECEPPETLLRQERRSFFDVVTRMTREAAARAVEVDRYRLAAQESTERRAAAAHAFALVCAEVERAQQRLRDAEVAQRCRPAAAVATSTDPRQVEAATTPPLPADSSAALPTNASADVVAAQLEAEMAQMRSQRQRYAALCARRTCLQSQLDELDARGKRLLSALDSEQRRRTQELEDVLASPTLPATAAGAPSASSPAAAFSDAVQALSVTIMERRELLRHLQAGSTQRLKHLRAALAKLPLTSTSPTSAVSGGRMPSHRGSSGHAKELAVAPDAAEASPPPQLMDMVRAHQTLHAGERDALAELEHVLLLLQRCTRTQQPSCGAEGSRVPHGARVVSAEVEDSDDDAAAESAEPPTTECT